jgi:ribosomal protein S6
MQETNASATEAVVAGVGEREPLSYELAFHVLPTVAEGEVASVFESIKADLERVGGELIAEETPQRFDLAYEVDKRLEGKSRRFRSAYFGWVRFRLLPAELNVLAEAVDAKKELLRYLLIRLTKSEEANPFYFHTALVREGVRNPDEEDELESGVASDVTIKEALASDAAAGSDSADGEPEAKPV